MNIVEIIKELEKFSSTILGLNASVKKEVIFAFERDKKIQLPLDYKTFLQKYNGITLCGTIIYGLKDISNLYSLEECYQFEHFEVDNPMPLHIVPFSPDGGGNHYCFDTNSINNTSCPIVFWQHDYMYTADDTPEIVNSSFVDWIKEVVIEWTLEDYNYDGTEKE